MSRPPPDYIYSPDTPPPAIDEPDEFGLDDVRSDVRTASWAAAVLVLILAIAAAIIFGALK